MTAPAIVRTSTAEVYDAHVMKNYARARLTLVRGSGPTVWDDAGISYLDFTSGIAVSAFIDADERQIAAAARAGFDFCEIHTGPYAHAHHDFGAGDARTDAELAKVRRAVELVGAAGMRPNAGHALNYTNVGAVAAIPNLRELHIGHAIVSRAVFAGLRAAVREMKDATKDATMDATKA
jgi:pyridoxine 5-phosphate synthase